MVSLWMLLSLYVEETLYRLVLLCFLFMYCKSCMSTLSRGWWCNIGIQATGNHKTTVLFVWPCTCHAHRSNTNSEFSYTIPSITTVYWIWMKMYTAVLRNTSISHIYNILTLNHCYNSWACGSQLSGHVQLHHVFPTQP